MTLLQRHHIDSFDFVVCGREYWECLHHPFPYYYWRDVDADVVVVGAVVVVVVGAVVVAMPIFAVCDYSAGAHCLYHCLNQ